VGYIKRIFINWPHWYKRIAFKSVMLKILTALVDK
jgi:hypothetical protein